MSHILDEFLALRRGGRVVSAADPERGKCDAPLVGVESEAAIPSPQPHQEGHTIRIAETELAAYFIDVLAAHPGASAIVNRRGVAEYLARSVFHRFGDPKNASWCNGEPVRRRNFSNIPWATICPAGHLTDEALWTNQVVGFVCERCEKIYDALECKLVPRSASPSGS